MLDFIKLGGRGSQGGEKGRKQAVIKVRKQAVVKGGKQAVVSSGGKKRGNKVRKGRIEGGGKGR